MSILRLVRNFALLAVLALAAHRHRENPIGTGSSQDHANKAARRWWQLTWMMKNLREELRPEERVSKVFHHPHVGIVGPTQHGKVAAVGGRQGISVDTARLLPQDARVTSHIYIQED